MKFKLFLRKSNANLWFPLLVPLLLLLLALSNQVYAVENEKSEFLSIASPVAILYDAPSLSAEKLYVANMNLPVEVVVKVEGWVKVRDSHGYLAWVESSNLSSKRFVIINVPVAGVHQTANHSSPLLYQAQQGVVLEWLEAVSGTWVKVQHQDGQVGYIRTDQIWGV
jgi:SH3-like domain-containing protein